MNVKTRKQQYMKHFFNSINTFMEEKKFDNWSKYVAENLKVDTMTYLELDKYLKEKGF